MTIQVQVITDRTRLVKAMPVKAVSGIIIPGWAVTVKGSGCALISAGIITVTVSFRLSPGIYVLQLAGEPKIIKKEYR